ncbi:unnamed protein product [Mytilus edulis]|uniref:Fucolectin tachylectin-4 pentraxin-1 domain-containing protein n=1 Tax=Mytilus edulis TaxID=6550 RepID=A0A8S3RYS9_MYTED|nr:unnamed protein product [Mytilus edulis]
MFQSTTVLIIMKFCCFPHCAVFCFSTACTFTVINAIDEDVISETFKTKGSTRIFQTENTTDVYCRSIFACAGICLSDSQCCVASYSKAASTCRIDTSERCCAETETLDEWRFIQRNSYHDCTVNLKEVAYEKPAEQSSVYGGGYASRAVDGNVNTYMHTDIEQSPYWSVDLGKTYQIKRIEIFNRIDGAISTDNCTINLKEVAYNKPAEQSSVYSAGCSALRAVDGNVNSFMHTNIEQSPYWIVDLGKIYQIKRIEILNRIQGSKTTGERLRDLDIMIGSSHNEMQICAHYVGPAQLGDHLLFTCGHVECARYVKLRLTGTDYLHVAEVKVYAVNDSCN